MTKKITYLLMLFICIGSMSQAQINLQNGLIAYYDFNNSLLDTTSNHYDLSAGGNPGPTADRFGAANMAYNLTGTNPDFFNGPFSAAMSPSELTLCAWINPTNPFNDQKVAGKTSVGPGYLMGVDSNKLDAEIWDANNFHMRVKSGNIGANVWSHVAISYKASGYLKIYINGVPVDSLAASASGVGINGSNAFTIGGAPWDNFALNFDGKVDDVCLYGRQLSDAEVAALFAIVPTNLNPISNPNFGMAVYPNPITNGVLNVRLNQPKNQAVQVAITDVMGNTVYQNQSSSMSDIIDVNHLANGVYVLLITNEQGIAKTQKIVISK